MDHSKLAQTQKLIAQIKKQLDTAERVLAHEAKFTQPIQVDAVSEKDVVAQAEEYLAAARTVSWPSCTSGEVPWCSAPTWAVRATTT